MNPESPALFDEMDCIGLSGLVVDCVVGVNPHERQAPQPLRVDAELRLDIERAATDERLRYSVDYASVAAQIAFLLESAQFGLLETAAHVLAKFLLTPPVPGERRAPVHAVRLQLTKPDALVGAASPSIEIFRTASWNTLHQEEKPFGTVDVIYEGRGAGVYRLNVRPGGTIPMHVHRQMQESELILGEGLLCQGQPASRNSVRRWPFEAPHTYTNPTSRTQSILCVDCPAFIEADEIPVSGPAATVEPEPPFAWLSSGTAEP